VSETTLVNLKEISKGGLKKKRDVNLPITKEHDQSLFESSNPQMEIGSNKSCHIERPGLLDVAESANML
jgi:hypothetical protein